jgi:U5 small nuclear ribonucleoprotein component
MIHVTKLFAFNHHPGTAGQTFSALGRIYSGSVKAGDKVKVMGEGYSPDDDEDVAFATVESVAIPRGRFRTEVTIAKAGSWVLLDGVDANIAKTATITKASSDDSGIEIFAPLKFAQAGGESVMKLSVEPLNPSELPKMVEGLRRISKSYTMLVSTTTTRTYTTRSTVHVHEVLQDRIVY